MQITERYKRISSGGSTREPHHPDEDPDDEDGEPGDDRLPRQRGHEHQAAGAAEDLEPAREASADVGWWYAEALATK